MRELTIDLQTWMSTLNLVVIVLYLFLGWLGVKAGRWSLGISPWLAALAVAFLLTFLTEEIGRGYGAFLANVWAYPAIGALWVTGMTVYQWLSGQRVWGR